VTSRRATHEREHHGSPEHYRTALRSRSEGVPYLVGNTSSLGIHLPGGGTERALRGTPLTTELTEGMRSYASLVPWNHHVRRPPSGTSLT
jgi:hypothetical protein